MPEKNFSFCIKLTSPHSWVFQGPGAGTLLHWINVITVVLACYRDATCMEGLCTGGKENIQLASEPRGCPQNNPYLSHRARECSAWRFPPPPHLLASSHNTLNIWVFFSWIFLIFLIRRVCCGEVVFWAESPQPAGNSQAEQEKNEARNLGSPALQADTDPFFSTRRVGAWVTLPWGVYAGRSLGKRSRQGQREEDESSSPLKLTGKKRPHDQDTDAGELSYFRSPWSPSCPCFGQILKHIPLIHSCLHQLHWDSSLAHLGFNNAAIDH